MRLYVAGQTPRSLTAFKNLKDICEEYLKGKYHIEVVDLMEILKQSLSETAKKGKATRAPAVIEEETVAMRAAQHEEALLRNRMQNFTAVTSRLPDASARATSHPPPGPMTSVFAPGRIA